MPDTPEADPLAEILVPAPLQANELRQSVFAATTRRLRGRHGCGAAPWLPPWPPATRPGF